MSKQERLEMLENAENLIFEDIELIRDAVEETESAAACERYILGHLDNWANGNNPYDDTAIPRLKEMIENDDTI